MSVPGCFYHKTLQMPTVEVCFSPALFPFIPASEKVITVVIDILRATTSFCTAFDYGVKKIIPLDSLEKALEYKNQGQLVAAERDGLKPDFADFSNSAFDYMNNTVFGKTIYYTTTNGTEAINLAQSRGEVAIASFLNSPVMVKWLTGQQKDIILLCSGWKNNYCIEDTLCAGLIAKGLLENDAFRPSGDSTLSAILLWESCNNNPEPLIKKSSHYRRLEKLGYENVLEYSLQTGRSSAIPVLEGDALINLALQTNNK